MPEIELVTDPFDNKKEYPEMCSRDGMQITINILQLNEGAKVLINSRY